MTTWTPANTPGAQTWTPASAGADTSWLSTAIMITEVAGSDMITEAGAFMDAETESVITRPIWTQIGL